MPTLPPYTLDEAAHEGYPHPAIIDDAWPTIVPTSLWSVTIADGPMPPLELAVACVIASLVVTPFVTPPVSCPWSLIGCLARPYVTPGADNADDIRRLLS